MTPDVNCGSKDSNITVTRDLKHENVEKTCAELELGISISIYKPFTTAVS